MLKIKIETFCSRGKDKNIKKHIIYFPGNFESFRDQKEEYEMIEILPQESKKIKQYNLLFGFGIFDDNHKDFYLHTMNYHSRSMQNSMVTYSSIAIALLLVSSCISYVLFEKKLTIKVILVSALAVLITISSFFLYYFDKIPYNKLSLSIGNMLRFVIRTQDPIDAGIEYVNKLLNVGINPSNIILVGRSLGGCIAVKL